MPLVVEAAESLFHPVVIRNNVEGYEGEVRERYKEPSWNNPVTRFVDGKGEDVTPRKDRQWSTGQLIAQMTGALEAAERDVPSWLATIATETSPGDVETALFAMY